MYCYGTVLRLSGGEHSLAGLRKWTKTSSMKNEKTNLISYAVNFRLDLRFTHLCLQEDEAEIAKRKRKEEDEYVDIMGDLEVEPAPELLARQEVKDEDILWAESEPDKDDKKWNMKVLLADESDY